MDLWTAYVFANFAGLAVQIFTIHLVGPMAEYIFNDHPLRFVGFLSLLFTDHPKRFVSFLSLYDHPRRSVDWQIFY